jgi:phage protein U
MASRPALPQSGLSAAHLLTLGMFLFGMDTMAYSELTRRLDWRHPSADRMGARPARQYAGPGEDAITIAGLIVPEVAGSYTAIATLIEMADTGQAWPLMDGLGRILGAFVITNLELTDHAVMAGGIPRARDFTLTLTAVD